MPKGEKLQNRRTRFADARTGREINKLTSWNEANCTVTYMYLQGCSRDERYLVFASDRTGSFELYRLELATGETVQLTDKRQTEADARTGNIVWNTVHPNGREVLFCAKNAAWAIDLYTLEERLVARPDKPGWTFSDAMASLSVDGKWMHFSCRTGDGIAALARVPVTGGPIQEVYRWDKPDGQLDHLLGGMDRGRPVITFAPSPDRQNKFDLPREQRARDWKLDPATGQAEPFLVMPAGFRCTHEYWGAPDFTRMYYHKKTVPTWTPAFIESVASDGSDRRVHYQSDRKLGHSCMSPDGRWIVSDVQDPTGNELILIDPNTSRGETLCWPNTSVADGVTGHAHPFFSPSGRRILYTSDVDGKAGVYMVDLST